ncbi:hypothetical protein BH09VER1_BH09VER1_35130 [soil metagenome]
MQESSHQLNIFLVENHPDTLTYLGRYLEQRGHSVAVARDMETALAALPTTPTDVLICDIGLPDGDGWELMRRLGVNSALPFAIAMSGYGTASECARSLAVGYRHHLVKPFVPEELDALLDEAAKSAPAP